MSQDDTTLKIPASDIQKLDAGTKIELYVLDTSILGGTLYYLSPHTNYLGGGLVWKDLDGNTVTYTPFPIVGTGFDRTAQGTQPRPQLVVGNTNHLVGNLLRQFGDLCGTKVVRRRVLGRHIDAINFPGGVNPTADRSTHMKDDVFYIERMASETGSAIKFELATAFDTWGLKIPARIVQRNLCPFEYQGTDDLTSCPFPGPFTGGNADCAKSVDACKAKYPNAPLPFGGFTGARRM